MDIILKNISKRFGDVLAIQNLTITIKNGKLTSILGPSGCGKTTLLNLIAGIEKMTSGIIQFDDIRVNDVPISERNVGYVFQNYALYPNMTIYENLLFPLTNERRRQTKKLKAEHNERIMQIADTLHITQLLKRKPSELSGGQQQRVAIGRALIRKPSILLMDEPLANLDTKLAEEMREEIRDIQTQTQTTTLFVTHNQADARAISDEIIVMDSGMIKQAGTAKDLYDNPQSLFVASFFSPLNVNVLGLSEYEELFKCDTGVMSSGSEKVVFRPEHVTESEHGKEFVITQIISNGIYDEKILRSNNLSMRCVGVQGDVNDVVRICIPPNKIMIFRDDDRVK